MSEKTAASSFYVQNILLLQQQKRHKIINHFFTYDYHSHISNEDKSVTYNLITDTENLNGREGCTDGKIWISYYNLPLNINDLLFILRTQLPT